MKAPVVALKQPGNHGPHAGSICQKICPQRPKPGKYDYFAQPESYSRSGAWEFFTENYTIPMWLSTEPSISRHGLNSNGTSPGTRYPRAASRVPGRGRRAMSLP